MTIKNVYVADDGEEFETEEECLEYEKVLDPDGAVVLFDSDMRIITKENCGSEKDPVSRYEETVYICIIDAKKAKEWFNWIYDKSGYDIPIDYSTGDTLYYNSDDCEYVNLEKEIAKLEALRNKIYSKRNQVSN